MDKSKEFILMCERAVEIQKRPKLENGDWFVAENTVWTVGDATLEKCTVVATMRPREEDEFGQYISGKVIWLPRQDQLQEMIFDSKNHSCIYYLYRFRNWIVEEKSIEGIEAQNWSMEQLWLAFVMSEKFSKQWVNNNWKKC